MSERSSGLVLLTGGARSGKSSLALRVAEATGRPVVFVATAHAGDGEMEERIARHRAERPAHWDTIEEPRDLAGTLRGAAADACVLVDCLSLWLFNVLEQGASDADAERLAGEAAALAAARPGPVVAVTNEVGQGIVPATPSGRRFRDVLGRVNARWAQAAERVVLVVAGRPLPLPAADWLLEAVAA
jgi:adenosyl cobinamide kinase/adenosyl cobinamide phosphate guanylyltransferase